MAFKIRLRNDTRQNWLEKNPTLSQGEIAIELQENDDRVKIKVGNGKSLYSELPYFNDPISYNSLENKPKLNGFEINGDRPLSDYGIQPLGSYITLETATNQLELKADKSDTYTKSEVDSFFDALIKLPEIGTNVDKFLKIDNNGQLYWAVLSDNIYTKEEIDEALDKKIDKVYGYSLMSNEEKAKLSTLQNFDPTSLEEEDKALWNEVKRKAYTSDIQENYYDKTYIDETLTDYALREDIAGKANASDLSAHITNTLNPHKVTKAQIGLSEVDNTADLDKPISNAMQEALDNKQDLMEIGFGLSLVDGILKNTNPNVNADWNANDGDAYIINKPNLSKVALSNDYNDLDNKPNIPDEYDLPIASKNTLGGIKIGNDFSIDDTGVLIAQYPNAFLDYNALQNKPSIWGTDGDGKELLYELTQGMTKEDLDIAGYDETQSALNLKADKTDVYDKTEIDNKIDEIQAGMVNWNTIGGNPADNPTLRGILDDKANVNDLENTNQSIENLSESVADNVKDLEDKIENLQENVNDKDTKVVHIDGDETIADNKTFTGVATFTQPIHGAALNAYWGDLCEYNAGDDSYDYGTLVQFGGKNEFTIAKDEVNAVVANIETAALIINSHNDFEHPLPIVLTGRVKVKVEGTVKKFDKLYLSMITPGVASNIPNGEHFGRALTDNADGYVLANVIAHF